MSDIHLPVFCLLGGGAGGRILDKERERDGERDYASVHCVHMYMLTCRLGGGRLDDFVAFIRERVCAYVCESVCVREREILRGKGRERGRDYASVHYV